MPDTSPSALSAQIFFRMIPEPARALKHFLARGQRITIPPSPHFLPTGVEFALPLPVICLEENDESTLFLLHLFKNILRG
ncbi:MAG: hypothetical protein LBE86_12965 [Gemmobacter sp.]|jgi:hypothetical protein|nr:hypothetical protein [Gemmobacter sp.]